VGGNTGMIENFLGDLAPLPQKGKAMPKGMITALLRIDTGSSKCPLEVGICTYRIRFLCVLFCVFGPVFGSQRHDQNLASY